MIKDSIAPGGPATLGRLALFLLGAAALALGLYGRFKGIGVWPFGVDEFYISRSIDNILTSGMPRFACGGYYTRGLLYQYLVAGMRVGGMEPELAGRLLAGLSSLAVLPAAYLLARRIAGSLAGWLTVIILCISVWEIEMARFARMYAPFQAVFTWYLVFYLRCVVDHEARALRWMAALSIVGVLLWEGGVFLGAANILAVLLVSLAQRDPRRLNWARLAGLALLLALLFLATRDLRGFAELPGSSGAPSDAPTPLQSALGWFAPLGAHPLWLCGFLVPVGLFCAACPWLWSLRRRWLTVAALCIVIACAAAHLFTLSLGCLALMLLTQLLDWRDLAAGRARYLVAAGAGFLLFWTAFYLWAGTPPSSLASRLLGFPDIYDSIVRPWGRTLPLLSTGLALAVAFWCVKSLSDAQRSMSAVAALLTLLIAVTLAVGATATERIETRYTFFLYPLLLVFGVCALVHVLRRPTVPLAATALVPLLCFAATEDFQPRHVLHVDSAAINFRAGMSAVRAAHYYPRDNIRGVGEWLAAHRQPGAIVIADIPSLEQYYPNFDYFFLEEQDPRYEAYVCKDGATERWTDHPVLYGLSALEPLVASGRPVYASLYADDEVRLRTAAKSERWSVTPVWSSAYGDTDLLLIAPGAVAPSGAAGGTP